MQYSLGSLFHFCYLAAAMSLTVSGIQTGRIEKVIPPLLMVGVLYTVIVSYPRMFPIARLIPGQTDTFTMRSQTVLRNQPFGLQRGDSPATGNCP